MKFIYQTTHGWFCLFLLAFFNTPSFAQSANLSDSLSLATQWSATEDTIMVYYRKGQLKKCLTLAQQALVRTEKEVGDKHLLYGKSLVWVGTALNWVGQNQEGVAYLEKGKSHLSKILSPNDEFYLELLNNLGMTYKDMGLPQKALPLLRGNIQKFKDKYSEDSYIVSIALNNLALLYQAMDNDLAAIEVMKEAIEVTKKSVGKEHRRYSVRVGALANLYNEIGAVDTAVQILENVLPDIIAAHGKTHPAFTSAGNNLVNAYIDLGDYKKARTLIDEVLEEAEKVYGKKHRSYAIYLTSSAKLYALNKQWKQALTNIEENLAINSLVYGKNSKSYLIGKLNQATFLEQKGSLEAATKAYLTAQEIMAWLTIHQFPFFSEKEQEKLLTNIVNGNAWLHSFIIRHPQLKENGAIAYNQNLLIKNLLRNNQQNLLHRIEEKEEKEVLEKAIEWNRLKTMLSQQYTLRLKKRNPALDSLEIRANVLESQLAASTFEFKQNQAFSKWQAIQATLEEKEVAIEYSHFNYWHKGRKTTDSIVYVAYILHSEGPPQIVPLFSEKDLGNIKASRSLYQPIPKKGKPNLHQLIWQPLSAYLIGKTKIYFSPSGLLHRINFGAIPIDEQTTIAQKFELQHLGSTSQLIDTKKKASSINSATIFSDIAYDRDTIQKIKPKVVIASRAFNGNGGWNYLPYSKKEGKNLQHLMEGLDIKVQSLRGIAASEAAFKQLGQESPAPELIHLATHAYFVATPKVSAKTGFKSAKNPLIRSGLILAGGNPAWQGLPTPTEEEDGILTAYEIAQMDLSNTKLVVLSACETGLGDIDGSEGVYGLQRALKIAGVDYILMSLWSVDDKKTYEFMRVFYDLWLNKGKNIPEAYQFAQIQLQQQYAKPFNPNAWAGFILVK